jgi:hypothetical protein
METDSELSFDKLLRLIQEERLAARDFALKKGFDVIELSGDTLRIKAPGHVQVWKAGEPSLVLKKPPNKDIL